MTQNVQTPEMGTTAGQSEVKWSAQTDERATIRTPALDMLDDKDTVTLTVDLPGADAESLDVNVNQGVLTIEAQSRWEAPKGYECLLGEYEPVVYRRTLRLSDQLDTARITAQFRQGVLRLMLPKREEAKTRRIPIAAS